MSRIVALVPIALLSLFLGACTSQIGDECTTSSDCTAQERRTCDTSAPGGYCTLLDCTQNSCPKEAVCVDFGEVSACMLRCDQRDCSRSSEGYVCREDIGPVPFCYIDTPADEG